MSAKVRQPSDFGEVDFYEAQPEGFDLFSWSPSPEGNPNPKPVTQVHMHIPLADGRMRIAVRFKGPDTLDRLIGALIDHRKGVWGPK